MRSLQSKYSFVLKEHPHTKQVNVFGYPSSPSHAGDFPLASRFTTNQQTHLHCQDTHSKLQLIQDLTVIDMNMQKGLVYAI